MITVNIWLADESNVGHASLLIGGGSPPGPVLVSWWPHNSSPLGLLVGADAVPLTYEQEVAAEGHPPHHRIPLFGLDDHAAGVPGAREHIGLHETDMKEWWRQWQLEPTYRLFDRSCCSTTIRCLMSGGAAEYADLGGVEVNVDNWLARPDDVLRLANALTLGIGRSRF